MIQCPLHPQTYKHFVGVYHIIWDLIPPKSAFAFSCTWQQQIMQKHTHLAHLTELLGLIYRTRKKSDINHKSKSGPQYLTWINDQVQNHFEYGIRNSKGRRGQRFNSKF